MNTKLLTALIFVSLSFTAATLANDAREQIARIVAQIQRADYEGDQAAMQRGYDELKPFMEDQKLASRIRYWRGFAQWRRAINGFNDSIDPKESQEHLKTALDEIAAAWAASSGKSAVARVMLPHAKRSFRLREDKGAPLRCQ